MKSLITGILVSTVMLSGCVAPVPNDPPKPTATIFSEFDTIAPPKNGPVVAAVYSFEDKTGQRKPNDQIAHISTAVTQGADVLVIQALQEVGKGQWFKVVERVGLENLARERQIIRQTRDSVQDATPLVPMLFAGMIVEGAIVGYDSNVRTGGAGARVFGVGPHTEYREDVVTITMRAVSVQTGEILVTVAVTKTILSQGTSAAVFTFFDAGTESFETEVGGSMNEPVTYAVRAAIEQAVVELIKEGAEKKIWSFK